MVTKPIHIRLSEEMLRQLDDVRREESDLPNRSEMIRRLIERAANSQKTK